MSEPHLSEKQLALVAQIAADVGAKTALDRINAEQQKMAKEKFDKRLRNTKLLLRNYRLFKAHVSNAVYEAKLKENALDILEGLMMPGMDNNLIVESIKRSTERTAIIVAHIETMMRIYQAYCATSGADDDLRRWRVVDGLYIHSPKLTVAELAKSECVVERTIYKDIDAACEVIAPLMFGIDGIRKR